MRVLHLAQSLEDHLGPDHAVRGLARPPVQRHYAVFLHVVRGHVKHVAGPPDAVEEAPGLLQRDEDVVEVGDSALVERGPAPLLRLRDFRVVLQNGLSEAVEGLLLADGVEDGEAVADGPQDGIAGCRVRRYLR